MDRRPLDVAFVATWFPAFDDPIAGRFVADQAEALVAAGIRPTVVSFELAGLIGSGGLRDRLGRTVAELAGPSTGVADDLFAPGGVGGPERVPVARLTIPHGRYRTVGAAHGAVARGAALGLLGERWSRNRPADPPRPALVHAHTVYPDGAGAVALADGLGVPLVITEHASFVDRLLGEPAIRDRYVAAVRRSARLVVVSRTLANELVRAVPDIEARVVVIPNPVDLGTFRHADERRREPGQLLYVGYRKASKGLATLLESFAIARHERPGLTLRLVGGSPTAEIESDWRRLAARLGVLDAVTFDPPADRTGIADAMARATLFVHPSPRETFGVVAAEALASGLPVVATDSGGVTEILGDPPDPLGAVVPPGDPRALAAAIGRTLDRRSTFDGAALRASAATRFGSSVIAERLRDLYADVLDRAADAVDGSPLPGRPAAGLPGVAAQDTVRVVVALDPDRAPSVGRLPPAVRSRMVLVTSAEAERPAGLAGFVTAELQGRARAIGDAALLGPPTTRPRQILRALRHPLAVARRRGLLPGLERLVTSRGTAAVDEGLRVATALQAGADRDGPPMVVCVDGIDHLAAVAPLALGRARLAAGGLRHLADLDTSGAPEAQDGRRPR